MAENPREEKKRIRKEIRDFCFGQMKCKGCAECPLNEFDVCGEHIDLQKYRKAAEFLKKEVNI